MSESSDFESDLESDFDVESVQSEPRWSAVDDSDEDPPESSGDLIPQGVQGKRPVRRRPQRGKKQAKTLDSLASTTTLPSLPPKKREDDLGSSGEAVKETGGIGGVTEEAAEGGLVAEKKVGNNSSSKISKKRGHETKLEAKPVSSHPKSRVLDFMRRRNRPYSCQNVADFLKKTVPKSVVQRQLDELCKGDLPELRMKTYGKAQVYFYNQERFNRGDLNPMKIAQLEKRVETLNHEAETLKKSTVSATLRLKRLREEPEDDVLESQLEELRRKTSEASKRLEKLASLGPQDSAARKKLVDRANKYRSEWKKRRRQAMDAIDLIADGLEKKPKEVVKMLDLETDADAGDTLPEPFE